MNKNDIKSYIKNIKPFEYLDSNDLDRLIEFTQLISFAPGEILLKQGQPSKGMYIILEGNAEVSARILGKGNIVLAIVEKLNFVGEINLIEKSVCTATVVAIDNVQCLLLSSLYFDALAVYIPEMYYKVLRGIISVVADSLLTSCAATKTLMSQIKTAPSLTKLERIRSNLNDITLVKDLDLNLRAINALKNLSDDSLNDLTRCSEIITIEKKYPLINENQYQPYHYLLIYGAVQAVIIDGNKAAKLAVLGPSSFFGHINEISTPISYITCEKSILLKIDFNKLMSLHTENINLWYLLQNNMYRSMIVLEKHAYKLFLRLNSERTTRRNHV